MDVVSVEFGFALALLALGVVQVAVTFRRERLISGLDLRLRGPVVPDNVLETVRGAEVRWYAGLPRWRRLVKDAQDVVASVVLDQAIVVAPSGAAAICRRPASPLAA